MSLICFFTIFLIFILFLVTVSISLAVIGEWKLIWIHWSDNLLLIFSWILITWFLSWWHFIEPFSVPIFFVIFLGSVWRISLFLVVIWVHWPLAIPNEISFHSYDFLKVPKWMKVLAISVEQETATQTISTVTLIVLLHDDVIIGRHSRIRSKSKKKHKRSTKDFIFQFYI